jgi:hypothetical protein
MQISKKSLNLVENFLTNIFKNIIWHLFAGESYKVVKITVTYGAFANNYKISDK